MVTQKIRSRLGTPCTSTMPSAAPHSSSMMKTSSRASASATRMPWLEAIFGVRKNGMVLVKAP
ncbi:hypothetical protein D3C76_1464420 [compost metagenome]